MSAGGPSKGKSSEYHIAAQRLAKRSRRGGGRGSCKKESFDNVIKAFRVHDAFNIVMRSVKRPLSGMTRAETAKHNLALYISKLEMSDLENAKIGVKMKARGLKLARAVRDLSETIAEAMPMPEEID